MADDVIGNGNKAWQLLISKIDSVHTEVKETRSEIGEIGARVTRVEARIDLLPCDSRLRKIDSIADSVSKLRDVQTTALSKKQLVAAMLTAAIAGAGIAARFL